jgi:aminoglycoside 6'-N-acetyltransferase I
VTNTSPTSIRELRVGDLPEWVRLRRALWPDAPLSDIEDECRAYIGGVRRRALPQAVFVIDRCDGRLGGFQEVSVRGAVEGCATSRVAYLEGLLVERSLRRQGWAKRLVMTAEQWAIEQGCREIASDVLAGNHISHRVHLRLGYGHARPLIVFRKPLGQINPDRVHTAMLAEVIEPSAAISLVQDAHAPCVRLAAAVVAHRRFSDGRELLAEEIAERAESDDRLRQLARHFHEERGLAKLAALIRVGRVGVGETWGMVAASATDAASARDAAEEFLSRLEGDAVIGRTQLWRSPALSH